MIALNATAWSAWLPELFLGLAAVLLVAAAAVWNEGRKIRSDVAALLALPADLHPMEWPERARPVLQRAGVHGLRWDGQWFGDQVGGAWGQARVPKSSQRRLEAGPDCSLTVHWVAARRADEAGSRALTVLDVFLQLWLLRMREKTQAVAVAMAQRAHVHLFWQHDMRNLAQWVGMLADEFGQATEAELPRLAQRLRRQAPLAQERARKLLAYTASPSSSPPTGPPGNPAAGTPHRPDPMDAPSGFRPSSFGDVIDPLAVVQDAALLAGLPITLAPADAGRPMPPAPPAVQKRAAQALERALDNLFSNIARDEGVRTTGQAVGCTWSVVNGHVRLRLDTPRLSTPWPERPFEPMRADATSGIGLYQARRSLRDVRGDLKATPTETGVVFDITLSPAR